MGKAHFILQLNS